MAFLSLPKVPVLRYYKLLRTYLAALRLPVLALCALVALNIGLQLINPQVLRVLIDTGLSSSAAGIAGPAVLFAGLALVQLLATISADYTGEWIGWTAANRLRADLLEHCLRQDGSFFQAHPAGELIERIDGDVRGLSGFFAMLTVSLCGNLGLIAGVLAVLFYENIWMGAAMTLFVGAALLTFGRIREWTLPFWVRVGEAGADFYACLGDQLSHTEDTRSSGAEAYALYKFRRMLRQWFPRHMQAGFGFSLMWAASVVILGLGTVLVLALGTYLWTGHLITVGTLYMMLFYMGLLAGPIEQIRDLIGNLQRAEAHLERIGGLLAEVPVIRDPEPGEEAPLGEGPLSVDFRGVRFSYGGESGSVLSDLTFSLQAGQSLGIVGRTGSGKTSVIRLLLRLYDPAEGTVLLGGTDIRRVPLAQLRERVCLVTQEVRILSGSVRDNVTFFAPHIPDERIVEVLDQLGLGDWYRALPSGLDTEIRAEGEGLSAGEAQLLALARIFLRNPSLVILDEASSRLDPSTEEKVQQATNRLLQGRTAIVIAHRLNTLRGVNRILVMDGGRIAEQGSRQALTEQPGSRYSRLLRQTSGKETI
ncbi:ABC transporter ATP-binding protein [Paenibacillus chitinolyticus]|uniref:ABC transporter ATP-binding protein n=1 Tax=Paenibacillus chitinolyticus TaxID=79263 RepID=UPI00363637F4